MIRRERNEKPERKAVKIRGIAMKLIGYALRSKGETFTIATVHKAKSGNYTIQDLLQYDTLEEATENLNRCYEYLRNKSTQPKEK